MSAKKKKKPEPVEPPDYSTEEMIEVVDALNEELNKYKAYHYSHQLEYRHGYYMDQRAIWFLGIEIWTEEWIGDSQQFNEDTGEFEPLIDFVRRLAIREIQTVSKFWASPTPAPSPN